ncbi:MAG: hypothetical protein LBU08_03870 [Tannerellaceae bacterium]|nr:hypothetical protein [Tannerellaceae bacterium]
MERILTSLLSLFTLSLLGAPLSQALPTPPASEENLTLLLLDQEGKQSASVDFGQPFNLTVQATPLDKNHKFTWNIKVRDRYTGLPVPNPTTAYSFFEWDIDTDTNVDHETYRFYPLRANTILSISVADTFQLNPPPSQKSTLLSNTYELYVNPVYAGGVAVSASTNPNANLFLTKEKKDTTLYRDKSITLRAAVCLPPPFNQANLLHYPPGLTDTLIRWRLTPANPLRPAFEMQAHPDNAAQVSFRAINSLAVDTVWVETYDHPSQVFRDSFILRTDTLHLETIALQVINPKIDHLYAVGDTIRLRAVLTPPDADCDTIAWAVSPSQGDGYDSIAWTVSPSREIEVFHGLKNDPQPLYPFLRLSPKTAANDIVTLTISPKGKYVSGKVADKKDSLTLSFSQTPVLKWTSSLKLSASTADNKPLTNDTSIAPYQYITFKVASLPADATNPTFFILSELPDHMGLPVGILSADSFKVFAAAPHTNHTPYRIFAFAIDSLLAVNALSINDVLSPQISPAIRQILDKAPKDSFFLHVDSIPLLSVTLLDKAGLTESFIEMGQTIDLVATLSPTDATFSRLEWGLDSIDGASPTEALVFLQPDQTETSHTLKALLPATVDIYVKSLNGKSDTFRLHILGTHPDSIPSGVTIKSESGQLSSTLTLLPDVEETLSFFAHISPSTASLAPLSWSALPSGAVSIRALPVVEGQPACAKVTFLKSNVTVTLIASTNNGIQGTHIISVLPPEGLVLQDAQGSSFLLLDANQRIDLFARYIGMTPAVDHLEWIIEDPSVVSFDDGLDGRDTRQRTLKALKPSASTTVTVSTVDADKPLSASILVSVRHRPATAVLLRDPEGTFTNRMTPLSLDSSLTLTAFFQGEPSFTELAWNIHNPDVVAFADNRQYAPTRSLKALAPGYTAIQVTTRDGTLKDAFYALYVKEPALPLTPPPFGEGSQGSQGSSTNLITLHHSTSPPSVRYQDGLLILQGLNSPSVRVLTLSGRLLANFPLPNSTSSASLPLSLAPGLYLLLPSASPPVLFLAN